MQCLTIENFTPTTVHVLLVVKYALFDLNLPFKIYKAIRAGPQM